MQRNLSRRQMLAGSLGAVCALALGHKRALALGHEQSLAQEHEQLLAKAPDLPDFIWALGIEDTFIPDQKPGLRALDEFELTQHYGQWRSDLDKIANIGVRKIRWGLPWYKVEPSRGKFDWSWSDQVLNYMIDELHIDPILDMIHYGTPSWLPQAFLDPNYPQYAAEYAAAVVQRYPKVRYFTPMNEPTVCADFTMRRGEWPPYGKSEEAYVKGMLGIARGIQAVTTAIRNEKKEKPCIIVAVEAMHKYGGAGVDSTQAPIGLLTDLQAWDLSGGVVDGAHRLYKYYLNNGATEAELLLLRQSPVQQDWLGVNFYPWSVERGQGDKSDQQAKGSDLKELLKQTFTYAKVPLFVSETSCGGSAGEKKQWMQQTIDAVHTARAEGVPVVGYTWFPAFAMIDWAYRTNDLCLAKNIIQLGLYDGNFDEKGVFHRKETELVAIYQDYVKKKQGP